MSQDASNDPPHGVGCSRVFKSHLVHTLVHRLVEKKKPLIRNSNLCISLVHIKVQQNGAFHPKNGDSPEGNARDDNDTLSVAMPSTGVEDVASQINEIGSEDCNPPVKEEKTNERDISLDQNPLHSLPHLISSSAPINSLLMQRRMHFCGWISDNEPNDICTKQLIPAIVMQLEKVICGTNTHSKSR
ncbi:hypothetical protein PVL29_020913 [Vitis rotundifolia]|uniref:Uncharacterized protein n=1 Tax=Vitis rotundifolia TaxID=103349 RepID=A0AA39DBG6_VITRO|nr:hypothetical protein PVL29_020913 [Vitis rotundifolia]